MPCCVCVQIRYLGRTADLSVNLPVRHADTPHEDTNTASGPHGIRAARVSDSVCVPAVVDETKHSGVYSQPIRFLALSVMPALEQVRQERHLRKEATLLFDDIAQAFRVQP
jgi:hypothetical protein